jgi:hypothetical protein
MSGMIDRRAILGGLAASSILLASNCNALQSSGNPGKAGPVQGTFLQLDDRFRGWTATRWQTYFSALGRLGFNRVYLQWTFINGYGFVGDHDYVGKGDRFLGNLMEGAAGAGTRVVIGLVRDTDNEKKQYRTPVTMRDYLDGIYRQSGRIAESLYPRIYRMPSFGGWYLPAEIDDESLADRGREKVWQDYLVKSCRDLASIAAGTRTGTLSLPQVYTSSYVTGKLAPERFTAFWENIWSQVPVIMLLQDGSGVRFLPEGKVMDYMSLLDAAAQRKKTGWGIVLELFRQTHGYPLDKKPFAYVPASLERIEKQVRQLSSFRNLHVTSFSAPIHMFTSPETPVTNSLGKAFSRHYHRP